MAVRPIAYAFLRLIVGGVFIYAGVVKAFNPQQFAIDVQNYQLTPWTASLLIAIYLPWLEILCGAAILTRRLEAGALLLTAGMLTLFLGAITSAWSRGLDITCGCFSTGERSIQAHYPLLLAMDIALLVAAGLLLHHALTVRRQPAGNLRDALKKIATD